MATHGLSRRRTGNVPQDGQQIRPAERLRLNLSQTVKNQKAKRKYRQRRVRIEERAPDADAREERIHGEVADDKAAVPVVPCRDIARPCFGTPD